MEPKNAVGVKGLSEAAEIGWEAHLQPPQLLVQFRFASMSRSDLVVTYVPPFLFLLERLHAELGP